MVFWSIGFGARTIYVARSKPMEYKGYSYLSYENVETVNEKSVLYDMLCDVYIGIRVFIRRMSWFWAIQSERL